MENDKHILLTKYKELDRPISQYELNYLQKNNRFHLNLSNKFIKHADCKHKYLCRRFGKKFKLLQEDNSNTDIGNCSACWRISHTEFMFKGLANDLANEYSNLTDTLKKKHYNIELENFFHFWLYK